MEATWLSCCALLQLRVASSRNPLWLTTRSLASSVEVSEILSSIWFCSTTPFVYDGSKKSSKILDNTVCILWNSPCINLVFRAAECSSFVESFASFSSSLSLVAFSTLINISSLKYVFLCLCVCLCWHESRYQISVCWLYAMLVVLQRW